MMFWKRKIQKEIDDNFLAIHALERKIKQFECDHTFRFRNWDEREVVLISYPGRFGRVFYKCPECGKIKRKYWKYLTKKEQQALRILDLVPEDWAIKGDNK
ncbi:hypothetical protein LCGC14_0356120 [marine sediment metagenome]|uniref:Uncharacterized protein n=1 Tax=marine sediment metagenome TaxID=412755 RepID=A0A0F9T9I9_9ZZZZ